MNDNLVRAGPPLGDEQPAERPNVPRVGAVAPDFQLPNTSQQLWRLDEQVRTRPVILLFSRGYW